MIDLHAHGLRARFIPYGAVLQSLELDGHDAPLTLGFPDPAEYPAHSRYFGAMAGRYANRIAGGRFAIDGQSFQVDQNFLGRHTLHGGSAGMGKRNWAVTEQTDQSATFEITQADGDMGFPGALTTRVTYTLAPDATLRVEITATTTAPTLCNIAHHSYWCLDGSGDLSGHSLQVDADHYTPVDADLIPTGQIAPTDGTRFDFRTARPILDDTPIDHNLCLSLKRTDLRRVARLRSDLSGVSMELSTTEPGLQVYDGALLDTTISGLSGRPYGPFSGVALEPQVWPDAPNQTGFPDATLRPGETYHQVTEFRFTKG